MQEKQTQTKKTSFKNKLDNHFQISSRHSNIRSETIGGVVNFMVLVYVMVVIPNILTGGTASPSFWNAIYLATLLAVIFSTIFMAFHANLPLASAPGIGLSSYFATLVLNGTYTYYQTLTIALVAGLLFVF